MQPIERYALVTLLFLVALVVVVAFWNDDSEGVPEPKANEVARLEDPSVREQQAARRATSTVPRGARAVPLSSDTQGSAEVRRVRTRAEREGSHSVEKGAAAPAPAVIQPRTITPQSEADLQGLMKPEPRAGAQRGPKGALMTRPGSAGRRDQDRKALSASIDQQRTATSPRPNTQSAAAPSAFTPHPADSSARQLATPPKKSRTADVKRPSGSKSRTYTIRSGDTLERIARHEMPGAKTLSAVDEIARLNGLSKPYTIYAGDDLQLPATSAVAARSSRSGTSKIVVASGGRSVYTVKSGDVLSTVLVARYGTYKRSMPLVVELNPGLDPDRVIAGTKIVMPRADEIPGGTQKVAKSASRKPSRRAAPASSEFVVR